MFLLAPASVSREIHFFSPLSTRSSSPSLICQNKSDSQVHFSLSLSLSLSLMAIVEEWMELANGCVCCTVQTSSVSSVSTLLLNRNPRIQLNQFFRIWFGFSEYKGLLQSGDDFVWRVDSNFNGRFVIDVEFLDLKISSVNVSTYRESHVCFSLLLLFSLFKTNIKNTKIHSYINKVNT
ncbi:hypothetical protein GIB67_021769 [Kingdonia uniflora]|uniref:CobW/HypB/UreG nucleotide-binding domain-containing protein n=1 Tax=Kingdonia uniflora TaxID=39325 RepID=A0A7J7M9M7_9MAGN|nr:hypothetical protein GIB67_021769 [Kingdonia uniflora]